MSEIADFSKLTIDVLRLIERFTYLTKSNRFNLPNLINLIELMNKYDAGNREIWMALAIDSELKTQADSRWKEVSDYFQQGDVDFINARRLLKDPHNIKDIDVISNSSLMVFGALVTARTQYLFNHPSANGWKNESERQINAPILSDLYSTYSPWMKKTPFWNDFDRSYRSLFNVDEYEPHQNPRPKKVFHAYFEDLWGRLARHYWEEARLLGLELNESGRHEFYVSARFGEEDFLDAWVIKVTQDVHCEFHEIHILEPEWKWQYDRPNFYKIYDLVNRLHNRYEVVLKAKRSPPSIHQ